MGESLLRVSGEERSLEILISFHYSGSTNNLWHNSELEPSSVARLITNGTMSELEPSSVAQPVTNGTMSELEPSSSWTNYTKNETLLAPTFE